MPEYPESVRITNQQGEQGSQYIDDTSTSTPPSGTKFTVLQFIVETVVETAPGTTRSADGSGNDGLAGKTIPANTFLFGRWDSVKLTSGTVNAYIG